jgi:hypothetical protein
LKAEFTSITPAVAKVTLGDDSVKHTIEIESLGAAAAEQVSALFRSANAKRFPKGNVAGDVVFTASKSHATIDAAATYYAGERARINQQGTLELTFTTLKFTYALATLRAVEPVPIGTRWRLRYTFGVTTLTIS